MQQYDLAVFEAYHRINPLNPPLLLWHYTDENGFRGIVEKGEPILWFTRSDCLNDESEGQEIISYYRQVCNELVSKQRISQDFYNRIKDYEPSSKRLIAYPSPLNSASSPDASTPECEIFICSFSGSENSLEMWRYYAKKGGYALGFLGHALQNIYKNCFEEYKKNDTYCFAQLNKVIYIPELKKQYIELVIENFYKEFLNYTEEYVKRLCCAKVQLFLNKTQFLFKNPCFSYENEYRLVYYRPIVKPENLLQEVPLIKQRNKDGMDIPYIEVENKYITESFNSVYISPFLREKNCCDQVKAFLTERGFANFRVEQSTLPVRY